MTAQELYKAIGVAGYETLACWRKEGVFHLQLSPPSSCHRCPQCGNRDVIHRGQVDRVVHAPRIGMDRTVLFIKAPRLECRQCKRVLNAVLPHVVPRSNHTKSFARMVVDLRKMMTIRDVARYLGVSEGMVRGIDKAYLQKEFGKPRLRDLEVIAIDEIYVGRRNKFFTIVMRNGCHPPVIPIRNFDHKQKAPPMARVLCLRGIFKTQTILQLAGQFEF